jgi:hypothetical protein
MPDESNEADQQPKPVLPAADSANPLPYEAPRDRLARNPPLHPFLATANVLTSAAAAAFVIAVFSVFLFMGVYGLDGVWVIGCLYLLAAAGAPFFYWRSFRASVQRDQSWWLNLGLLIGAGLACLIVGAWFVAQ